ncbi:MAG: hypothetical protein ACLGGX_12630 [Bdellovibrionia bacterium]
MNLINSNLGLKDFLFWFLMRKETRLLLVVPPFFCLVGMLLYFVGKWHFKNDSIDVLYIFLGLGISVLILILFAPIVAFKRSFGKVLTLDSRSLNVISNEGTVAYQLTSLRCIYQLHDTIIFEFKKPKSISVYGYSKTDIELIKERLKGSRLKLIKAPTLLHILLKKYVFELL